MKHAPANTDLTGYDYTYKFYIGILENFIHYANQLHRYFFAHNCVCKIYLLVMSSYIVNFAGIQQNFDKLLALT